MSLTRKVIYEPKLVTLTDAAAAKVRDFMKQEGKLSAGLRFYVTGGGCSGLSYGLAVEDSPNEDDVVVEENGIRVFVDAFTAPYVRGSVIDYADSLQGSGFKIENPNVTSTCGCGHSFKTG